MTKSARGTLLPHQRAPEIKEEDAVELSPAFLSEHHFPCVVTSNAAMSAHQGERFLVII